MRKKTIAFIMLICFSCLPFVHSQTLEEFEQLSVSRQLDKMIEVYGFDKNFARRLQFAQWSDIILKHPDELKFLLIEYLKKYPVVRYSDQDQRFMIIDAIVADGFIYRNGALTDSEKVTFLEIYQEKIDSYLREYKSLDAVSLMLCNTERTLKNKAFIAPTMFYVEDLLKIYKELGYSDISINYAELEYIGLK